MSITRINSLGITDGTIVNGDINSAAAIATTKLGAGAVLQVVNAKFGTLTSSSSVNCADTGLTASITPTSATSKLLIQIVWMGATTVPSCSIALFQDATANALADHERSNGSANVIV